MLKQLGNDGPAVSLPIGEASFPSPFPSGLEYSAPARGTWNIVHTGMLLPESHQIFVCAAGCLRGVVLTAAEMGASHRFSTIAIEENNVLNGDMEELIIDGVTDILNGLSHLPRAVLLYTSCIHHFMGCDLPRCHQILRQRFPQVAFTDCYMNPIMRKSGLTPDQLMRRQLYSFLPSGPKEEKSVNIIGNDFVTDRDSELMDMLRRGGCTVREIGDCRCFDEYLAMSRSAWNITYQPAARAAGEELERRLGQKHLYLPYSLGMEEIDRNLYTLAEALSVAPPDTAALRAEAEQALREAAEEIGGCPIAIDYTAVFRPLGLARLLLEHGFQVTRLYADSFTGEEEEDFRFLQQHAPSLMLYPTVHPSMRRACRQTGEKILAIGQKAAYFTGSDSFVNIVECDGMYGYRGIIRLAGLMRQALREKKDARRLIQIKGWGCSCCQ